MSCIVFPRRRFPRRSHRRSNNNNNNNNSSSSSSSSNSNNPIQVRLPPTTRTVTVIAKRTAATGSEYSPNIVRSLLPIVVSLGCLFLVIRMRMLYYVYYVEPLSFFCLSLVYIGIWQLS